MSEDLDEFWELVLQGSEELALALGVDRFDRRALVVIDEWLSDRTAPFDDDEEVARLGFFLARVLVDSHGGGLTRIEAVGHPLHGEWAVTGFTRGLSEDFHVPFLVSAVRIAVHRSLPAVEWYRQLLEEGEPAPAPARRQGGGPRPRG